MSKRLIKTCATSESALVANTMAKIYYDSDVKEYQVKFWFNGEYKDKADYFTDDKQDAIDTAVFVLNRV